MPTSEQIRWALAELEAREKAVKVVQEGEQAWDAMRGFACGLLVVVWIALGWRTLGARDLVLMAVGYIALRILFGHFRMKWAKKKMVVVDALYPMPPRPSDPCFDQPESPRP